MATQPDLVYSRYLQSYTAAKMGDGAKAGAALSEEVDVHVAVALGVRDAKVGAQISNKTDVINEVGALLK